MTELTTPTQPLNTYTITLRLTTTFGPDQLREFLMFMLDGSRLYRSGPLWNLVITSLSRVNKV